jgi:hypothetical protein
MFQYYPLDQEVSQPVDITMNSMQAPQPETGNF